VRWQQQEDGLREVQGSTTAGAAPEGLPWPWSWECWREVLAVMRMECSERKPWPAFLLVAMAVAP
jgi:hypothetical protein